MGYSKAYAPAPPAAPPIGGTIDYFGLTEPDGWFFPNGQEISISTYGDLYNALTSNGTTFPYGANTNGSGGAGSTHFRLPDMRGKAAVMRNLSSGVLTGTDTIGTTGGTQTHTLTPGETASKSHTHSGTTANDNVDHSHSGTTGTVSSDHIHSGTTAGINANHYHFPADNNGFVVAPVLNTWPISGSGTSRWVGQSFATDGRTNFVSNDHGHSFSTGGISANHTHAMTTGGRSAFHQHTFTTGDTSGGNVNGTAHNNMQPHMRVNKLIRAV